MEKTNAAPQNKKATQENPYEELKAENVQLKMLVEELKAQ